MKELVPSGCLLAFFFNSNVTEILHNAYCSDGHVLQSIQHLTALEEFRLYNYNGDGMELEWQGLRKLQYLRLFDHPKLASLPVGFNRPPLCESSRFRIV
nr:hypothetical protein CFP56_15402 [Quercus suber]